MKLYQKYCDELKNLGEIRRAWFTSFNLSPAFVENYILPPLVDEEPHPADLKALEVVQAKLVERKVDVQLFCDARMYYRDERKKTAVNIHRVDVRTFPVEKVHNGKFHPKVCLLQNVNGKTILITGSANLTVSGWGRNCEAVAVKQVKDRHNSELISEFFRLLHTAAGVVFPADFQITANTDTAVWRFLNSLNPDADFIGAILEDQPEQVAVWTPFCAKKFHEFKDRVFPGITLHVIPDLAEGQKIRIPADSDLSARLQEPSSDIVIHVRNAPELANVQEGALVHAKVWLTNTRQAVGSWNATLAGTGCSSSDNNNVEAGIIEPADLPLSEVVRWKTRDPKDLFMDEEEYKKQLIKLEQLFPVAITILFDWSTGQYTIRSVPMNNNSAQTILSCYHLKLPGMKHLLPLSENKSLTADTPRNIVRNHVYSVVNEAGEEITHGLIIESGIQYRPVLHYESLDDLFVSWARGNVTCDDDNQRVEGEEADEDLAENGFSSFDANEEVEDVPENGKPSTSGLPSYFRMFRAFYNFNRKVDEIAAITDHVGRDNELRKYAWSLPGSVDETCTKVRDIIEKTDSTFSAVYRWFMVKEANRLVSRFSAFNIKDSVWQEWCKRQYIEFSPGWKLTQKDKAYLKFILDKCDYV